ncbi:hypothetical protein AVEN_123338-1, partial [Araneus ventricosus]
MVYRDSSLNEILCYGVLGLESSRNPLLWCIETRVLLRSSVMVYRDSSLPEILCYGVSRLESSWDPLLWCIEIHFLMKH